MRKNACSRVSSARRAAENSNCSPHLSRQVHVNLLLFDEEPDAGVEAIQLMLHLELQHGSPDTVPVHVEHQGAVSHSVFDAESRTLHHRNVTIDVLSRESFPDQALAAVVENAIIENDAMDLCSGWLVTQNPNAQAAVWIRVLQNLNLEVRVPCLRERMLRGDDLPTLMRRLYLFPPDEQRRPVLSGQ